MLLGIRIVITMIVVTRTTEWTLFLQVSNYLHYNALLKLGFISEVIGCPTPKVGRSKLLEEGDGVTVLRSLLKIKVILNFWWTKDTLTFSCIVIDWSPRHQGSLHQQKFTGHLRINLYLSVYIWVFVFLYLYFCICICISREVDTSSQDTCRWIAKCLRQFSVLNEKPFSGRIEIHPRLLLSFE